MISISCTRAHDIMLYSSFVWWDSPSVKYDYWLILSDWNLRIHVGKKLQVFRFFYWGGSPFRAGSSFGVENSLC